MDIQNIFMRYEIKYLLTRMQKARLLRRMDSHMTMDRYGRSTIRSLYYDTEDHRLIRRSLEKPAYKEKLRVRSYRTAQAEDPVFVELKKKHRSVVYKRRIELPRDTAEAVLAGEGPMPDVSQIGREIDYFRRYYRTLQPAALITCEREAYFARDDDTFRITFDENILARTDSLSLGTAPAGSPLLSPGEVLLEVKTRGGMPLWLTRFLTENRIYPASFSKYGEAYTNLIFPRTEGVRKYA